MTDVPLDEWLESMPDPDSDCQDHTLKNLFDSIIEFDAGLLV
jgi:hypothetical protein